MNARTGRTAAASTAKNKGATSHEKRRRSTAAAGRADEVAAQGGVAAATPGLSLGALPDFVGYSLRRAQIAVFEDFRRTAGGAGLRPGQFSTLIVIDANPAAKQSDVAAMLGIQGTNFVAMINELSLRGFVERRALDRRSYGLHLTDAGREIVVQAQKLQDRQEQNYEDILGPGGRQMLLGLLARLTAGLTNRYGDGEA